MARPNPSVEARPNGKAPRPPTRCAYHPSGERGTSPPAPHHLERKAALKAAMSTLVLRTATCCAFFTLAVGVQAQPRPEYVIKEDLPRLGSLLRREMVGPTQVPVNLPYGQLSPKDKATFHANYERIADGDEPPFPRDGLRAVLNPIIQAQAELLVEGDLSLIATIGPDGKVIAVKAIGSPSPEMTRIAAQVLAFTPYKPAVCAGEPCTMDFPLRLKFRLD